MRYCTGTIKGDMGNCQIQKIGECQFGRRGFLIKKVILVIIRSLELF